MIKPLEKLFVTLFGCWHRDMSRPFTRGRETYLLCLECGARRRFDLEVWKADGDYYYEPPPSAGEAALDYGTPGRLGLPGALGTRPETAARAVGS